MNHIELNITCQLDYSEIVMAELSYIGFDTIEETDEGFNAYILEGDFEEPRLKEILNKYAEFILAWSTKTIEKKNWNKVWEQNYDPIIIEGKCIVKATFHDIEEHYPYEITINPKMSFGTGHHETTYQILDMLTTTNCTDKVVMDAGCGTGVLAIMAKLRGAKRVEAFDIDDWCIDNSKENFDLNKCDICHVRLGTIAQHKFGFLFDLVIANINKNVLLDEMSIYSNQLQPKGVLMLSGFYESDIDDLKEEAFKHGMAYKTHTIKNNWAAAIFVKNK